MVKKFQAHGTCRDRRVIGLSPSKPRTTQTLENVTRIQELVGRSPSKSLETKEPRTWYFCFFGTAHAG